MGDYRYRLVNVFAEDVLEGNPLCVFARRTRAARGAAQFRYFSENRSGFASRGWPRCSVAVSSHC